LCRNANASRHVAHRVVAGFARGQANVGQKVQRIRHLLQGHEVILHVLPRGQMAFIAAVAFGHQGQVPHLLRGQQSAGDLGADHVDVGLALAVDAAPQPERTEFIGGQLAGGKLPRLGAKQLDVGTHGRVVFLLQKLLFGQDIGGGHTIPLFSIENSTIPSP
jgi:hypothetical protein